MEREVKYGSYNSNEYELIHPTDHHDAELIEMKNRCLELFNMNVLTSTKLNLYFAIIQQEYAIRYPLILRKKKVCVDDT